MSPDRGQGIMIALPHTAAIRVDLLLAGGARDSGFGVGGIAHPRGRPLRGDRFPGGPRLRVQIAPERGHPIGTLFTDPQSPFAGVLGLIG